MAADSPEFTGLAALPAPTIVETLSSWAKDKSVIKRSRIPIEKKVIAAVMCASGYTSRDVSQILGGISHVAVHDVHKSVAAALPPLAKKRRLVSIEENATHLNKSLAGVIWLARDVESGEILSFRCSVSRSAEDGKKFIDSVLAACTDRPLLRVGRGPGFPHSLKSLDLYFQIDTTPTIRQRISNFFLGGSEPRR
jgi:transposase-like protein